MPAGLCTRCEHRAIDHALDDPYECDRELCDCYGFIEGELPHALVPDLRSSSPGFYVISADALTGFLRRAYEGEDPDLLLVELYANCRVERVEGDGA